MSLHVASTGLVFDAFTGPTSKHLTHTSPNPLPKPKPVIDSPPKGTPVKLASSPTLLQILNHVVDLFLLQERAHRPTVASAFRQRRPIQVRGRVQRL